MGLSDASVAKALSTLGFSVIVGFAALLLIAFRQSLPLTAAFATFAFSTVPFAVLNAARGGFVNAAYLVAICGTVAVCAHGKFGRNFWFLCVLLITSLEIFYLILWGVEGFGFQYRAVLPHKNFLGTQAFLFLVVCSVAICYAQSLIERAIIVFASVMAVSLIVISSSRASLVSAALFFLFLSLWRTLRRRALFYYGAFWAVLLGSIFLVPFYTWLSGSAYAFRLDQFSLDFTGQSFFSGRNFVWPAFLKLFAEAPMLGHGFNEALLSEKAMAEGLSEHYASLSAHNLYLMIGVQTGIVGLIAFALFVAAIWRSFRQGLRRETGIVAAAFLAFLVHEMFEVTLVQSNVMCAWVLWILIGATMRDRGAVRVTGIDRRSERTVSKLARTRTLSRTGELKGHA